MRGLFTIAATLATFMASTGRAQPAEPSDTPPADSGSRTSSLSWVRLPGAEACATAPELAGAVEARLRREVFVAPRHAQLSVEGRVAPRPAGGFTATFAVATADGAVLGERELEVESADCGELTATVAFVVAVLIDPDAEAPAPVEEPTAAPSEGSPAEGGGDDDPEAPPAEDAGTTGPPPREDAPASRRWSGEVDGGLGVAVGLLPEPAIGGFGAVLIQTPWLIAFEFGGALYPYSPQGTATGDALWLAAFGGLLACTPELSVGDFGLRGCGGGELGFVRVSGAVDPAQDRIAGHVLIRARLTYRPWRGLVVWTRPTLAINPQVDPYVYAPGGVPTTLYAPETVAAVFDVGLGWVFD